MAQRFFAARTRARRFAAALAQTFALRDELRALAQPDTLVCRCEDVPYGQLRDHASWQSAKLHTRCGMGPCQGRVCGAATAHLFGWTQDSVRPPIAPARLESLAQTTDDGRWTMDDGRWTMDDGRWTMDDGRWTMDDGR